MINPPKTRAEAEKLKYGGGQLNFIRIPFIFDYCAYAVNCAEPKLHGTYQCSRKPGHGPDGLYCKQHARKVEK